MKKIYSIINNITAKVMNLKGILYSVFWKIFRVVKVLKAVNQFAPPPVQIGLKTIHRLFTINVWTGKKTT